MKPNNTPFTMRLRSAGKSAAQGGPAGPFHQKQRRLRQPEPVHGGPIVACGASDARVLDGSPMRTGIDAHDAMNMDLDVDVNIPIDKHAGPTAEAATRASAQIIADIFDGALSPVSESDSESGGDTSDSGGEFFSCLSGSGSEAPSKSPLPAHGRASASPPTTVPMRELEGGGGRRGGGIGAHRPALHALRAVHRLRRPLVTPENTLTCTPHAHEPPAAPRKPKRAHPYEQYNTPSSSSSASPHASPRATTGGSARSARPRAQQLRRRNAEIFPTPRPATGVDNDKEDEEEAADEPPFDLGAPLRVVVPAGGTRAADPEAIFVRELRRLRDRTDGIHGRVRALVAEGGGGDDIISGGSGGMGGSNGSGGGGGGGVREEHAPARPRMGSHDTELVDSEGGAEVSSTIRWVVQSPSTRGGSSADDSE